MQPPRHRYDRVGLVARIPIPCSILIADNLFLAGRSHSLDPEHDTLRFFLGQLVCPSCPSTQPLSMPSSSAPVLPGSPWHISSSTSLDLSISRFTRNLMVLGAHGERTPIRGGESLKNSFSKSLVVDQLYSGCDLPSHLYSFSFNLNPNWSKQLCEQPEILQCKLSYQLAVTTSKLTGDRHGRYCRQIRSPKACSNLR